MDEIEVYQRQIKSLETVASAIVGIIDLDRVLNLITGELVDSLGYIMPSIHFVDRRQKKLFVREANIPPAAVKVAENTFGLDLRQIGFDLDQHENILVRSFNDYEQKVTDDFQEFGAPVLGGGISKVLQGLLRVNKMVAVPIGTENEVMGVLALGTRKKEITDGELKVLKTFANQISIAIYNARLYKQGADQLEVLNEQKQDLESLLSVTESAIQSLDPAKVSQTIVDAIPAKLGHLGFITGIILHYDQKQETVNVQAITENEMMKMAFKLLKKPVKEFVVPLRKDNQKTMVSRAVYSEQIQLSDHLSDFVGEELPSRITNRLQKLLKIQGLLCVPMKTRGHVTGVFALFSQKNVNTITQRERDMAVAFANNIAGAVENARLHDEVEMRIEELQEKNAYLKALDETKSNFLSIASHQLRTPISGIRGYLDMLNSGDFGELNEKQAEIVAMNLDNANRMVKVINMFLNISRIEAGRLKLDRVEANAMEMISSVVEELKNQINQKGLTIEMRAPKKGLPLVQIDEDKMRQVVLNLIDNSAKYTEEGGITVIPTYNKELESVEVEVKDTGIGISKEDIARLFGKFVRAEGGARANANGSGLGLYIIKKITEAHGGEVWVESEGKGKGSSFFIRFPIKPSQELLDKEAREHGESTGGYGHVEAVGGLEGSDGFSGSALSGVG